MLSDFLNLFFAAQLILLLVGYWRKSLYAFLGSAVAGFNTITWLLVEQNIEVISSGQVFYFPAYPIILLIALIVIFALVGVKSLYQVKVTRVEPK